MSNDANSKSSKVEEKVIDGPIICPGHSRPVPDLAYSKLVDGRVFLTSSCLDGKPMLRDADSGDWIGTFQGHNGAVWCCRLNSTTERAVSASADFSVKIWDALTGDDLYTWEQNHVVKSAIFSQDDKSVIASGLNKTISIYDVEHYDADPQVINAESPVHYMAITKDPNVIIGISKENAIKLWDIREMKLSRSIETEQKLTRVQLSHDEKTFTTCAGKEVAFWDLATFKKLKSFTLERELNCAAFHEEAGKFVTGSPNELWVRVYDYETGKEVACNKGHHGPVRCIDFNPSGKSYASGSEDGTIRIWEF